MGAFEDWITKLRPSWMGDKARGLLGGAAAVLGDQMVTDSQAGLLEQLPRSAQSALSIDLQMSEKQLEPGPSESYALKRERIEKAIDQHRLAGTALGLCLALHYAELYGGFVIQQNGLAFTITSTPVLDDLAALPTIPSWFSITTLNNANPAIPASPDGHDAIPAFTVPWWSMSGGDMDADGNQFTSRFIILFPSSGPFNSVDFVGQPDQLDRIRRVIAAWKPAKATCVEIIDQTGGLIWGWPLTQNWGDPGLVWGGTALIYSP